MLTIFTQIRSRLALKEKAAAKGKALGFQLSDGCSVLVKVCNPLLSKMVNLTLNPPSGNDSSEAAVIETLFLDHMLSAAATTSTSTPGQSGALGALAEKFRYYRSRGGGARTCGQNISAAIGDIPTSDLGEFQRLINTAFEEDTKLFST